MQLILGTCKYKTWLFWRRNWTLRVRIRLWFLDKDIYIFWRADWEGIWDFLKKIGHISEQIPYQRLTSYIIPNIFCIGTYYLSFWQDFSSLWDIYANCLSGRLSSQVHYFGTRDATVSSPGSRTKHRHILMETISFFWNIKFEAFSREI